MKTSQIDDPERFVSANVVAEHLDLSLSAVRKQTAREELPLPHHRLPGGRGIRYRLSEVTAWLEGHHDPS